MAANDKDKFEGGDQSSPGIPVIPAKRPASMVAPQSSAQEKLQPVNELAGERGMPAPALAGMCRANGWAEGKQVTPTEFETAMTAYAGKAMGSGRG